MKGKLSVFFLTTVAFLLIVISVPAPIIIPQQGGGGSTVSGSITGAYSFNGGLSTINATNVYLAPAISNLVLNLAITNVGASNRVLMSASETRITNAFKRFYFDTNVAHVLSNLVASASSGDVVELGAGDFRIGTQTIRPPVGVTLRGQGMGVTRIIGDVGVATNSIVQLMSTNIIEDLTVIAGKKSLSTFQYPIANLMIFGHPACTNVILRRVEIDGETDCLLISQTNSTSGTIEDSWFHSAWDVCNILDLDDGNAAPGANWTIRRTRLYADSATAQNPQGVANPKSQPFIAAGAIVNLINCELTATNHKAITIILQGFETNLISIFDGTLQSAGTNGFGKQVDITTDSDNSVSTVKVSGTLINDTALAGSTVVYYEPRQVSTLYTSGIKFVNGFASNSFLYLKADTNVAAATFGSGLTFSGGTLTASAGSSNFITTAHGSAYVTNSVTAGSFIGSGTGSPVLQLFATNNNAVVMGIAISNSVMITNLVGQLHKANAVYIELDCNHGNDFHITNRIAQNTIVNWLNPAQGQTLSLRLHGAVSGGTDYFVTNTFPTSWLVANQSSNSAPMAVQLPVSVLDGTGAELNIRPYRLFTGSTNIAGAIINTYTE